MKWPLNTLTEALHVTEQMVDQFDTENANKSIKALSANRGPLARIFAQMT